MRRFGDATARAGEDRPGLASLPMEVLLHVLTFVPVHDVSSARRSLRTVDAAYRCARLWRALYDRLVAPHLDAHMAAAVQWSRDNLFATGGDEEEGEGRFHRWMLRAWHRSVLPDERFTGVGHEALQGSWHAWGEFRDGSSAGRTILRCADRVVVCVMDGSGPSPGPALCLFVNLSCAARFEGRLDVDLWPTGCGSYWCHDYAWYGRHPAVVVWEDGAVRWADGIPLNSRTTYTGEFGRKGAPHGFGHLNFPGGDRCAIETCDGRVARVHAYSISAECRDERFRGRVLCCEWFLLRTSRATAWHPASSWPVEYALFREYALSGLLPWADDCLRVLERAFGSPIVSSTFVPAPLQCRICGQYAYYANGSSVLPARGWETAGVE